MMTSMGQIYSEWFPGSEFNRADDPEFEFYDGRFDVANNKYEMSVYIPVEKKRGNQD